jgi:hypothetical protein
MPTVLPWLGLVDGVFPAPPVPLVKAEAESVALPPPEPPSAPLKIGDEGVPIDDPPPPPPVEVMEEKTELKPQIHFSSNHKCSRTPKLVFNIAFR